MMFMQNKITQQFNVLWFRLPNLLPKPKAIKPIYASPYETEREVSWFVQPEGAGAAERVRGNTIEPRPDPRDIPGRVFVHSKETFEEWLEEERERDAEEFKRMCLGGWDVATPKKHRGIREPGELDLEELRRRKRLGIAVKEDDISI